jgi:hypothetical protein
MAIADYLIGTKHKVHAEQLRESLRMAMPLEAIQAQEPAAAATYV